MPKIIYLDETGDHSLEKHDDNFPLFVLTMVVCDIETYTNEIMPMVCRLKFDYFGHEGVIIHSREIRKAQKDFNFLQNPSVGSPPSVLSTSPQVPDFQLINTVRSAKGGGDDAYIYSTPYASVGTVAGKIPAGDKQFSISGALPDPPYFLAWHLRNTLIGKGLEVTDSATTQLKMELMSEMMRPRQTFFTWLSPNLATIVKRTNLESVNLYCEAFVRTIGLQLAGVGSNDVGTAEIIRYWQSKGVNTEGVFMQDGSGLSPHKKV